MENNFVIYDKKGKIAIITINRPDDLNALNKEVNLGLVDCLEKAENDDDVLVVILTGSGDKAFVAGADIKEMVDLTPVGARNHALRSKKVVDKIWYMSKPVIAMIDGYCLGGGFEYAMACDLRIVSEKSKFGLPEITLGIMPGSAGTQRLPRLIGLANAKELCLTGKVFGSEKALEYGLVNHVYTSDTLEEKTIMLAKEISERSAFSVKMIKTAMNRGTEMELDMAALFEIDCFALCFSLPDQRQKMQAFIDKKRK